MKYVVGGILLAGGNDQQLQGGAEIAFLNAGMLPVLARCLIALESCPEIQSVVVVTKAERADTAWAVARRYGGSKLVAVVPSATTRAACLNAALAALPQEVNLVVVHEVSRPLVRGQDLSAVVQMASRGKGGAATAFRIIGGVRSGARKRPTKRVPVDSGLWLTASPQACERKDMEKGLAKLRKTRDNLIDETMLMDLAGLEICLVEDARVNLRIQCADDLAMAAQLAE